MVSRRSFLKAAGSAGVLSLSGCASLPGQGGGSDTVKIGGLLALSGPLTQTGEENRLGVELAREYLDGEILGQEIELVFQDTESTPSAAVQGARTLVEDENVDAIIGPSSSATGIGVMPYIKNEAQIPMLTTTVSSVEARENPENCNSYSFFIWPSNRHLVPTGVKFIQALPDHVDRDIDPSRVHFVSPDYSLGQNNLELLREEMSNVGGEVTGSTLVPLGENDWSSYISEIEQSEADIVTGVLTWGSASRFIPQANEFGLNESKTMMFNSGKTVGQYAASTMSDEISREGWYGTHFYNPGLDTEVNNQFKQLYSESDSDLLPNSVAGGGFENLRALSMAMEEAGSTNPDDVVVALEGLEWESIYGPITFRPGDHQTRLNFAGAMRQDGEFTVLEEYPEVIGRMDCDIALS